MSKRLEIVIVGLGGIGTALVGPLCRFLQYSSGPKANIMLVDGDKYELKNRERQIFREFGNKAEVQCDELSMQYNELKFDYFDEYITKDNISEVIKDQNIIFVCVDNHKTRKVINDYAKTLNNIILISGGNELTDGNIQLYDRIDGKDITPDLASYHPEIANPTDKSPDEMSCEELSKSEPQIFFTNLTVATFMCCMFYNIVNKHLKKSEVYFDIKEMQALSYEREVKK